MEQDTQHRADLHFSLDLPKSMSDAAQYKAASRGYDSNVLFDSSRPCVYAKTLALITSVYIDTVKLIHFDGELLHIFMMRDFTKPKLSVMRRIFSTLNYKPDVCLNDILFDDQATFSTREQVGDNLVVYKYTAIERYEGPVDIRYLEQDIRSTGVSMDQLCSVVLRVCEVEETIYEGVSAVDTFVCKSTGELERIDLYETAHRNHADMLFASREISKVERYFQQTKFRAGNNARRKE